MTLGTPNRAPRPCDALRPHRPGSQYRGWRRSSPLTHLRRDPSPTLSGCRSRRARWDCARCPFRLQSSPSGSAGPWCRLAGSGRSGPRVAPRCHPWRRQEKHPWADPPCSAFPPSKAGGEWQGGCGWKQEGARLDPPKKAVAPLPSLLSASRPACLSVCLRRLVSSLQTQQPVSLLSGT